MDDRPSAAHSATRKMQKKSRMRIRPWKPKSAPSQHRASAFTPGKWSPSSGCERHRQEHSCHAAPAQHRAGGRDRQARQLCRADLEQPDQVSIRGRPLSGQCEARNHLGRALLQGFRQPAGQARSRAGAGAGAFRRSGDPGRRRGRRPLGDHRHVRLQRIAGRGKPAARRRTAAGHPGNRACGDRSELPRQSQRRRKAVHQHRRPHRHHGSRARSRSPANPARS